MSVSLQPITRDNWRRAGQVRVGPGQLALVADYEPVAYLILAKQFVREAGFDWHALAVVEGDTIVGVLALVDERTVRGGFALFHLVIDSAEQGRGLGRAAMLAAIEWVRGQAGAAHLRLTVAPGNAGAIRLYESLGFEWSQPWGDELGMTLPLPPAPPA